MESSESSGGTFKANAPVGYISRGDLIKAQRDKIVDDTIVEKGAWARLMRK
jgi:hypothetical protein